MPSQYMGGNAFFTSLLGRSTSRHRYSIIIKKKILYRFNIIIIFLYIYFLGEAILLILTTTTVTTITSLSMSAISTNGLIKGGEYYQ